MPKQLVPVAGRPVLEYVVQNIRELGITDIGIVSGEWGPRIAEALGSGERFGARLTYIPQDRPLGLAHCLMVARDFLGDDDFVVWLGDNMLLDGVTDIAAEFRKTRPAAQVVVSKVSDPRHFGVVELGADGGVRKLTEKPREPHSDLALIGIYFFTPAIHAAVDAITPSERGELELTDAIQWLLAHGHPVVARLYEGYWQDTGQPADVLACNRRVLADLTSSRVAGQVDAATSLHGIVVIEPGAIVRRSTLHGPLVIGSGAVVEDSRIGPNVAIGRDCKLVGADIADSILLDEGTVTVGHPLRDSLIGHGATVGPTAGGHRLVLSDHAEIGLPTPHVRTQP